MQAQAQWSAKQVSHATERQHKIDKPNLRLVPPMFSLCVCLASSHKNQHLKPQINVIKRYETLFYAEHANCLQVYKHYEVYETSDAGANARHKDKQRQTQTLFSTISLCFPAPLLITG